MKLASYFVCGWVAAALLVLPGCGGKPQRDEKAVYPIRAKVLVDGQPVGEIQVKLHSADGMDSQHPTQPNGFTDAEGNVAISTYAQGDGAPAGTYQVTFFAGTFNPISRSYGEPDKLKKRYSIPAKSGITWTITEGKNDLGTIELSTQ